MISRTWRSSLLLAALAGLGGAPLAGAEADPSALQVATGRGPVRIQFFTDSAVRVQKWPGGDASFRPSLVVVAEPEGDLAIARSESAREIEIRSPKLMVRVRKADGIVSFETPDGEIVLAENGPAALTPMTTPFDEALSVRQGFHLTREEGLYGLGQHQDSLMNYRGRSVKLVQTNTDAVTPVLVSTRGWGLLWDNCSKTLFEDGKAGASFWSEVADGVDYYFLLGPSLDQVIAGYRKLTGRAPMYGKWAYGYWQSKEHYHTEAELLGVAEEYRRRGIPIDNLVQDWNYWGDGSRWSGMVFDPRALPASPADGRAPARRGLPPDDLDLARARSRDRRLQGAWTPRGSSTRRSAGRASSTTTPSTRRRTRSTGSTCGRASWPGASTPSGSTRPSPT